MQAQYQIHNIFVCFRQEHSRRVEEMMKYQESLKRQLDDAASNERRESENKEQSSRDSEVCSYTMYTHLYNGSDDILQVRMLKAKILHC